MFCHSIIGLYQITASDRTSLVFVHGLGGHWYNTWSKNGVFWPRDLLSRDVQNVRIIVFGYDSDVVRFFGQVSRNQIRDHARTLVADLRRCRKKEDEVRSHKQITVRLCLADCYTRARVPLYLSLIASGDSW